VDSLESESDKYFYSLCHKKQKAKKVKCLKCAKMFQGSSIGNRLCSKCKRPNHGKNYYLVP